ncbi:hypothetical protein ACVIHA_006237 [Bradyrhizobium liaoningense]
MGDGRALRMARRARGVHDGGDVIERDFFGAVERLRGGDTGFIGAAGAEQQAGRNVAELCDGERRLG